MTTQTMPRTQTEKLTVPGPRRILGGVGNVSRYVKDPVGYLGGLFERYGPVVALARRGGTRIISPYPECPGSVFVYGPELVRKVKTPHASWEIPPLTGTLYPLGEVSPRKAPLKRFATGLWGVQGDEHRLHRKLLLPAFHKRQVSTYRDDIVTITNAALDRWRPGDMPEVREELLGLSARIATWILFGEEAGEWGNGKGPEQSAEKAWELVASPLTQLAPYDLPGLPYRRFVIFVTAWDDQIREIIARKRASGTEDSDVLSTLISSRDE